MPFKLLPDKPRLSFWVGVLIAILLSFIAFGGELAKANLEWLHPLIWTALAVEIALIVFVDKERPKGARAKGLLFALAAFLIFVLSLLYLSYKRTKAAEEVQHQFEEYKEMRDAK